MHSYLIIGKHQETINKEIDNILKKERLASLEYEFKKINDARQVIHFSGLSTKRPTAFILKNIDSATREALNAFLKNLEEPQENIKYILTAGTVHAVPATIVSRCLLINIQESIAADEKIYYQFTRLSDAAKFSHTARITKKDDAIEFLQNLIYSAHYNIVQKRGKLLDILNFIRKADNALSKIKANGNVSLQLGNFTAALVHHS